MLYFAPYDPDAHGTPLPGVTVRRATSADVGACAELLSLRETGDACSWANRLTRWIDDGEPIFVAEHEGRVVGYARLSWQTPEALGGYGAPDGYYLSGMIVHPDHWRRGIGRALTLARSAWVRERGERAYFVVNATNHASMDLHRELGYRELTRDFEFPGICFSGGEGVLFGSAPSADRQDVTELRVGATR